VNGNTVCSNTVIDIFCSESGSFTGTGNSATTKSEECTSIETSPC